MTLDYSIDGKVQIDMSDYIKGILESLPPCMDGESATPVVNHLFTINNDAEVVATSEAEVSFLCKHTRTDIQSAVSFPSTRMKAPDQDDSKIL